MELARDLATDDLAEIHGQNPFKRLFDFSARDRVRFQREAVDLLLENFKDQLSQETTAPPDPHFRDLRSLLSFASEVFALMPVQKEIYHNDSGTAFIPKRLKKTLVNIESRFVVRPGTLDDLQKFVRYAHQKRIRYTIRGAGTWPFGGAVPVNKDVILDLSYLDFHELDADRETITVGPGAIFARVRKYLRDHGFALQQDITNPNSGTICGWVATGGIGLGVFKYGHVRNAVRAILLLTPDGEWRILRSGDDDFDLFFGSEGQLGVIAGVILKVKRLTYVSKPYAFSFSDVHGVQKFMQKLSEWRLRPTSVVYFDAEYLRATHAVEADKVQKRLQKALEQHDQQKLHYLQQEKDLIDTLREVEHVVVLEFDTREDYEKALRIPMFSAVNERRRYQDLAYRRLSVDLAHKLWEHRYLPVEMKPLGPSMLVSETILPIESFPHYLSFIQKAISDWTGNAVKTEAHLINDREVLLQSIILADIQRARHKMYLGLVPFMTQAAVHYGGRPYGTGLWNLPFLKSQQKGERAKFWTRLLTLKRQYDPQSLINQTKFINSAGRGVFLRLFKSVAPIFMSPGMKLLHRGKTSEDRFSLWYLGKLLWRGSGMVLPLVVPPALKAKRDRIEQLAASCAECDSCERVCPTSDVFGLYGLATPITRRKTAMRIARGEMISQIEALGFLVCTRCDNCSRVCPTNIPLTELYDLVEADNRFQQALKLNEEEKSEFIDRFWQIMKENPLYRSHTLAEQKSNGSHLQHGLKILYPRGFAYGKLYIDPETCIRCGMCAHENACTYGARIGQPREIPTLIDQNCALCNACINFCPQNKVIQQEREFVQNLINHAVDLDEKRYWNTQLHQLRDTTTVQRATALTEMADVYVTEEILMEIDKECSTGQIPVSGMGQGDKHRGIGFDAERFSHFHIVGPAQNRLHEGDPDEELSVILGKRHRYCKFDENGRMHNPPYPKIKLKTPILYNAIPLDSHGRVELALMKVAEQQNTLVVIQLNRLLEYFDFFKEEGGYAHLPAVIVPRVDHELIHHLIVNPNINRELLMDLWQMPMFEIHYHAQLSETIRYITESVAQMNGHKPLLSGYLEISEYDMIGDREILPHIKEKIEGFLENDVDVIHIHGLRNKDNYFVTSHAVRAVHHYLLESGRRHLVSIIASGGIRLASDSQKTIQRGAEATLIDFAALLALDPYAYKAIIEKQTTTEKLLNLDIDWAIERLNNQMESRKVQILEVLGAAGFKDLKKTVGEEGRLIDFNELEERIQKQIFENEAYVHDYQELNRELIEEEPIPDEAVRTYTELKRGVQPLRLPHHFYHLGDENQTVYQRDHVWPGWVIESMGHMAAGDMRLAYLKNVKGIGLLGDGFDVMKILYQRDPDMIPESELDQVKTAVKLDKDLVLQAPWMFGGKSVGSIGLDSWRAHVIAAKALGIQFDTGEGGYPTCFFLNRKGEPIFFTEPDIQRIKSLFEHDHYYTVRDIKAKLAENGITAETHPKIFEALEPYPDLQPFLFYEVVGKDEEPYVSTELKTGLFGVTKETIKKARRVVIAYSQGAKMGIGGHILAQKVNKLVSYLRGIEGLEEIDVEKIQQLAERIERIERQAGHPLQEVAKEAYPHILRAQDEQTLFPELKMSLWKIQQQAYELHAQNQIDPLEFENILHLSEEVIRYSYTSIISPFPFHNCYSIEDVKAFVDMVRMINPEAVISVKVSPSVDIEFIAAGLGRIAKDNTEEAIKAKAQELNKTPEEIRREMPDYVRRYGMKIEVWLDGPRGGTGASPNIIKGQMGMHIEYAIPLIHHRLVKDGLRNYVKFFVSGGIRTYEDVIKAIALGADGVIWGTAPMVAIGCDRNRNCHDGCSRGIATSNLIMQKLRDVDLNARQITNAFLLMQMQVIRALAALGIRDIRELRGRFDKIQWLGLKERVDFRIRQRREYRERSHKVAEMVHATGQSNCGVAAVIGSEPVPSYILDKALHAMKNRGMDGVGVGKTLCFPEHPHDYAYRVMVKGMLQIEVERKLAETGLSGDELRRAAREKVLAYRHRLAEKIRKVFLEPYFDFKADTTPEAIREPYKRDEQGRERDYREFGGPDTDPGDIYRYFVRVKTPVLTEFIEKELLVSPRYAYIREYFPNVDVDNYQQHEKFLQKAEDLFVFNHTVQLSQILYVWQVEPEAWRQFVEQDEIAWEYLDALQADQPLQEDNLDEYGEIYLYTLRKFVQAYSPTQHKDKYLPRERRIAAVMSAGKNFAVWKTAGREIPWDTPAAPNNIIHVRLATGSVVEQMNAHPFAKLHTALTHNGETTNYETLKQRVEQFGLPPLATTDTEVASLKFHLVAEELEYPDWALFEAFSPTTGDDLALISGELRHHLEEVQRVEFTSSPDGPYQYLCLRHLPEKNVTERVDLKDPADLRPSTTAFWIDQNNGRPRVFSFIASEEQAIQHMLDLMDQEGLVDGAAPDVVTVSNGMISRFHYDDSGRINDVEIIDRYGQPIELPHPGQHYSMRRETLCTPENEAELLQALQGSPQAIRAWIREQLAGWDFNTYRWVLTTIAERAEKPSVDEVIEIFTYLIDYLRTMNTGNKAKSSLLDITRTLLNEFFDRLPDVDGDRWHRLTFEHREVPQIDPRAGRILLIDARGFAAEGTDPEWSLAALLARAYERGWRRYVLYRVNGQRLISTAVMGKTDTDDVVMDVYGTPGEYLGAFMQGGVLRVHGNAQNFAAMCMHHGHLQIFGNAGKVCGYASKGGEVFILGDIVDRAWTNSVNDPRCQALQVHILGSASKYAGESLMGGDFFFGGLYFDAEGRLRIQPRPYRGTKLLGGASRGRMLFFDPYDRLDPHQYTHGKIEEIADEDWPYWQERVEKTLRLAGVEVAETDDVRSFTADGKTFAITREHFKLIVAKGGLKGYESH